MDANHLSLLVTADEDCFRDGNSHTLTLYTVCSICECLRFPRYHTSHTRSTEWRHLGYWNAAIASPPFLLATQVLIRFALPGLPHTLRSRISPRFRVSPFPLALRPMMRLLDSFAPCLSWRSTPKTLTRALSSPCRGWSLRVGTSRPPRDHWWASTVPLPTWRTRHQRTPGERRYVWSQPDHIGLPPRCWACWAKIKWVPNNSVGKRSLTHTAKTIAKRILCSARACPGAFAASTSDTQ